jgi:hypothetical protein
LPDSGEILLDSGEKSPFTQAEITVEDMLEKKLLLRAFWEKVPTLRNFETLGEYIMNF